MKNYAGLFLVFVFSIGLAPGLAQTQGAQQTQDVQQLKVKLQQLEQAMLELKTQISAVEEAQKPSATSNATALTAMAEAQPGILHSANPPASLPAVPRTVDVRLRLTVLQPRKARRPPSSRSPQKRKRSNSGLNGERKLLT